MSEISEYEPVGVRIPILHPDELDRKLEDKAFFDRIAAVTTTSIDAVRRLLSDPGRNFQVYDMGHINLDLVDEVYDELIGGNLLDKIPPSETVLRNAVAFGHTQAVMGLLHERGATSDVIKELNYGRDLGWFTQKTLRDLNDEEIDEKLSSYKKISSYLRAFWSGDIEYSQAVETALKDVFPKAKKVTNYLKDLRERSGAQILLGDRSRFIEFARSHNHEPVDDTAITLYADIPRGLILGIVPRGQFEQQELLAV